MGNIGDSPSLGARPEELSQKSQEKTNKASEHPRETKKTQVVASVLQEKLTKAILAHSESAVDKLLTKRDCQPTASMVKSAITERCSSIASKLIHHIETDYSPEEWFDLAASALHLPEDEVIDDLVAKMPKGAIGDLYAKAAKNTDVNFARIVTEFLLYLPADAFENLHLSDAEYSSMLRHAIDISPDAIVDAIEITPLKVLESPQARSFLIKCMARAKDGDSMALQALVDKKVTLPNLAHIPQSAAEKGKARQAAMRMLEAESTSSTLSEGTRAKSIQTVVLMEKAGVVLKKTSERAKEDEELATNLFNLAKAEGVMPYVRMQDFSPERLGLASSRYQSGFQLRDFTPEEAAVLVERLDKQSLSELEALIEQRNLSSQKITGRAEYEMLSTKIWEYYDDNKWISVDFEKIANLILRRGKLLPADAVRCADSKEMQLKNIVLPDSDFEKAIGYRRELIKAGSDFLVPNTEGVEGLFKELAGTIWHIRYQDAAGASVEEQVSFKKLQKLYLLGKIDAKSELCELRWHVRYKDSSGTPVEKDVPYKELQELYRQGKIHGKVAVSELTDEPFSPISGMSFWQALSRPWHFVSAFTELSTVENVTLKDIQVKQFATGMKTVAQLSHALLEKMFARLDTNSEINAILLAELQFYDLHGNNLGLRVKCDNQELAQALYHVGESKDPISFYALVEKYLDGSLNEKTPLRYSVDGVEKIGYLKDMPVLLQAVQEAKYEFVLFDIDTNFAETNGVHYVDSSEKGKYPNRKGYYLPFRSCLLGLPFRDQPLSQKAMEFALGAAERDTLMLDWLRSSTSPVYQSMSKKKKAEIMKMVVSLASKPKYCKLCSDTKGNLYHATVAHACNAFAADLARLDSTEKQQFWQAMQEALSEKPTGWLSEKPAGWFKPYVVQPGDTFESIAKSLNLDQKVLRALNPTVDKLEAGMSLVAKPNLTAKTPLADYFRKFLASQLFPQATYLQIEAYQERLEARRSYLQSVGDVKSLFPVENERLSDNEIVKRLTTLQAICERRSTPLSIYQKSAMLEEIKLLRTVSLPTRQKEFVKLLDKTTNLIAPTYFNLCKAMYPLLADTWEVLMEVYHDPETAAALIGNYQFPMEEAAEALRKKIDSGKQSKSQVARATKKLVYFVKHLQAEIKRSQIVDDKGNVVKMYRY